MEHESCRGVKAVLNLLPNSISTAYHPHFGPHDDLMLLEINEKLLPDILYNRVSLRGQSDEEVVLCTLSKTYAIKFVGTTNYVFLVPPSDPSESSETASERPVVASVLKVTLGIMELVEVAPKPVEVVLSMLLHNASSFSIPHLSALRIWLGFSTFFSLIYIIIGFTLSLKDGVQHPLKKNTSYRDV